MKIFLTVLLEVVVFFAVVLPVAEAAATRGAAAGATTASAVETLWWSLVASTLAATDSLVFCSILEAKWPWDELRLDVRLDMGELLLILLSEEFERSNSPPRFLSRPLSLSNRRTIEATLKGWVFFTSEDSEDVFRPIIGLLEAEGIFSIKSFGNL